jgi:hypothetical protein
MESAKRLSRLGLQEGAPTSRSARPAANRLLTFRRLLSAFRA